MTVAVLPTLHSAFLDAFTLADLDRMMRYELDRVREHYSTANGLIRIVDDILQVANDEGWLRALVEGAIRFNPTNRELQAAHNAFQQATTVEQPTRSKTAAFSAETYPTTTIALYTAQGGAIGWTIAGLIIGAIFTIANQRLSLSAIIIFGGLGLLSGFLGGGLAGLLTGAIVRKISPRFSAIQLRRLGVQWAIVNLIFIIGSGIIGFILASQAAEGIRVDPADGSIGAIIGAFIATLVVIIIVFVMTMALVILAGLFIGANIAGILVGRQLRLADEGISRWHGIGITLGWIVSGLATIILQLFGFSLLGS